MHSPERKNDFICLSRRKEVKLRWTEEHFFGWPTDDRDSRDVSSDEWYMGYFMRMVAAGPIFEERGFWPWRCCRRVKDAWQDWSLGGIASTSSELIRCCRRGFKFPRRWLLHACTIAYYCEHFGALSDNVVEYRSSIGQARQPSFTNTLLPSGIGSAVLRIWNGHVSTSDKIRLSRVLKISFAHQQAQECGFIT